MRRMQFLLALLLLLNVTAIAQSRTITGRITDENGNPVPFASVVIRGSNQGTSADASGNFSIRANTGNVLIVSSQGLAQREVTIGAENSYTVQLQRTNQALSEVVVSTGYNTRRTQRSTVSNAQVVNSEQLTTIRQPNLNNALAGKVAGVQVRSQSVAALGRDATIRLRGEGGISGQTVLYVVDGTVVNSVDINPDDVEDLTVLNGPSGAAIYGPQAANGVVVINTKKARRNQRGVGIEINSGSQFDRIYIMPNYQNAYAGGGVSDLVQFNWRPGMPTEWQALNGKFYHDYTDDASWGPRMAGQEYIPWYAWYGGHSRSYQTASLTPKPNNARDFYNTGITHNNNINFSRAGENFNARVSYTNLDVKGLIPNSYLRRNTLATNASVDLSSKFSIGANFTYVAQRQQAENNDAYSNSSTGSFNQWFHRNLDMDIMRELSDLRSPGNNLASWNHANPNNFNPGAPENFYKGNYWYNPFSYFNNIENLFDRNRLFGDVNFNFRANENLRFRAAVRKNYVNTNTENKKFYIIETSATQTGERAAYGTRQTIFDDTRYELTGNYNRKIQDFSLDLLAGAELVKISSRDLSASTRNGLYIPDFFSLNNSVDAITQANTREEERRRAVFTRGTIGYKNFLFGEFTLRNDWYSTLPADDNAIFVKSFGGSFVFSDFTRSALPWLSYGKLRAAWGEVPQAPGPYNLALTYAVGADQWNGNFVMGTPNTIVSSNLRGAVRTTKELGLDLRFVNSRLGVSATYYDQQTKNSPITVQINGASGFTNQTLNAGLITQKGVDLQFFAQPLRGRDFSWNINSTFSKIIDNKVVELAPGVDQITVSSGVSFNGITTPFVVHQAGQQWGMLIGGGKTYIDGQVVLDADGHYVKSENVKFGSVLPDYTGGVQNSFTYKNFTLNVNIDFQKGGKFFSLSDMWGSYSGLLARTAVLNDKGNPIRDAVADGGGVHVVGVDANKNIVDKYIDAQDYFHSMVSNNVFDEFIYDLTFLKMREVSLGYSIPVTRMGNLSKVIQNASISLVARNPWLIYASTKDFDPSEIANVYGENGQFPGSRSFGFNLRIGF